MICIRTCLLRIQVDYHERNINRSFSRVRVFLYRVITKTTIFYIYSVLSSESGFRC